MNTILKHHIGTYYQKAKELEIYKKQVVREAREAVREKIIPTLTPMLPEGYVFNNKGDDSVCLIRENGEEIPSKIECFLEMYNPSTLRFASDSEIDEVNQKLKGTLEELSNETGIGLCITGAPLSIG